MQEKIKGYEFKCKNCNRILNKKKNECYIDRIGYGFCRDCATSKCIGCGVTLYVHPNHIKKCKKCKIKENKIIRNKFPSLNCVYLLYSKNLDMFKIGKTNSVTTRISRVKHEVHPSFDWEIVDIYPYRKNRLMESVLHARLEDYLTSDTSTDYFINLHFLLHDKAFVGECETIHSFLTSKRELS